MNGFVIFAFQLSLKTSDASAWYRKFSSIQIRNSLNLNKIRRSVNFIFFTKLLIIQVGPVMYILEASLEYHHRSDVVCIFAINFDQRSFRINHHFHSGCHRISDGWNLQRLCTLMQTLEDIFVFIEVRQIA